MSNPILDAINTHMEDVEAYLENVTAKDFVDHINDLRTQSADQKVIEKAILELTKLQKP